ncbi:NLR family CARD domain-containing protein 3-like isoform X3 [Ctenopharyngodon idella]|uniref:NLR family CARD domain-containing protein 3-like isoform X3 n=1 Tax=Ctenopharyngodon idella TaxID=7959 RepID=UPI00223108D9|nr:NLR family CARD domain-containing protein 3-like isoform X3 [Ctenopharyngodon idella]
MAALLIMSEERGKGSPIEISLPEEMSKRSHVSSSVSVKSHQSKFDVPNFSEEMPSSTKSKRSHVSSSVSVKSHQSKFDVPNFSEETPSSSKSVDSDNQTCGNFKDNLLCIFQDLENKIITFLKNELEKFKNILQNKNIQYFVKDFNENRCSIKEAALDLALYFLRYMKQDKAANTLEDELIFIHQLKCNLKKKYQCVFEGIAKHGDSILLNNIYTDLYITQGGSQQVNTEHEVRQIEVTSRHHESQEIAIECKNMFEAPEQDKEIRSVLTKGVAGIGKSVSVQKFVLDWAEGKENQDISFIFPLPFREMNLKEKDKQSLMGLIGQFFPEIKALNLTRRNNFKVLFILDGLDEFRLPLNFKGNETWRDVSSPTSLDVLLTNLIKGNLLPSALIWITTRPAAASKIPPDCIDRVTEIRGFSDAQKKEYFKKRFTDKNMGNEIIDHIKKSKSLFIMCHIPVFCWISATVLQNILEEKRNNELKNDQTNDTSKTLQESITEDTPKTLTQMYAHFLRFQIQQSSRKYDGEYRPDVSWDKEDIMSLGKLAFQQLERNNLVFYESDLEACGIDVYKASVYSGMCTQIFKEETGIILGTMYCFVHLSFQEFIAALYAHLFLDINKKSVFVHESTEQENKNEIMIDFLKTAVDKALKSDNGHLDLFLRFLLGLSLQSNQQLLRGLLTQQDSNDQSNKEIVQYIKQKFEDNLSPERSINLFYCLNELNDQTLVKEIQSHLSKGSLSSVDLSPAQWSAVAFVLLTSEEELEEFELQNFQKSDECVIRLSAVIKTSKRALLNNCGLTDKSCPALATVLGIDSNLKELNMNNNNLQDSGVKQLCIGLESKMCKLEILRLSKCELTEESCSVLAAILSLDSSSLKEIDLSDNNLLNSGVKLLSDGLKNNCKLEKLRLSDCSVTEEGYKTLASALRSNSSHLIELDLTGNDPGQSGVKELNDLLQDGCYKLKTIRFLKSPAAEEACEYLSNVLGISPLLLQELDLSEDKLGDLDGEKLSALLVDSHSKLEKMKLNNCQLTEKSCSVLATVLSSKTILKELDLNNSHLLDSGVKEICEGLKNPVCKLKILKLSNCSITEGGYNAVASALRSNPSHLIELDLTGNDPGQSGVNVLNDLLLDPNCKLKTLMLLQTPAAKKTCQYLTRVLHNNPLFLRELNLSGHKVRDSKVKHIAVLLQDKHCKLAKLQLRNCNLPEESCSALATILRTNTCLKELDISNNNLQDSGVKKLQNGLENTNCTLEKLRLSSCSVTEEGYKALASALRSNPLHLIELDLTGNDPGQSGVKELNDLLQDPNCKLKKLRFLSPDAVEACHYVTEIQGENPLLLRVLNLSECELGDTRVKQLAALLRDKHCKLSTLQLNNNKITEEGCSALASAFNLNPSNLKELDLSGNKLGNSGMKKICRLLENPQCRLEKLKLCRCNVTEKQYLNLTSALCLNLSHLRELDLSGNKLKNKGVKHLCDILNHSHCKLERLSLRDSEMTDEGCSALTSALKSNPSHLRELNLSRNKLGNSGVKNLAVLLRNPQCKLEILVLCGCGITEKQCLILALGLRSNISYLRELDLSGNKIKNTGVILLCDVLNHSHCKLQRLRLRGCDVTNKGFCALTSALKSNPSHLRELNLSGNALGDSGVENLGDLLSNSRCKLEKLDLCGCNIKEEQSLSLILSLCLNPSQMIELDLSGNKTKNTGVEMICHVLKDSDCKLQRLGLNDCGITDVACLAQSLATKQVLQLRELDLSNNNIGDSKEQLIGVLQDSNCTLNLDGKHCFTSWSKPQEPEKSTEDVRSSEKPHYSTVSMRFGESASHLVAVTKATSLKAERRDWEDVFHVSMIKRGRHKAALRTRKMEQRRKKNRIRTQSKWTSMTQDYPVHLSTPVHLLLVNLLHPVHF